jgi:hypothetical protein
MSASALTSIVFAMSVHGKFSQAQNMTYNAQKYNYAIDLYSPTNQGGQYVPYDSSFIAQNGFVKSVEGTNFIPNNMYDDYNNDSAIPIDDSYEKMFGDAYYDGHSARLHLAKHYYESQLMNLFGLPRYRNSVVDEQGRSFANMLYPNTDDGVGQQMDINYLKNRSMVKTFLNFQVGLGAMSTNP